MKINDNKKNQEKMIILSIIGSLEAIKCEKVSIDEIEKFIFSPRMCTILSDEGYDKRIIHILELGCEIENIKSLLPDRFENIVDDIKNEALELLNNYDEFDTMYWLEE